MVKYTIVVIDAILASVQPIVGRPTFSTIWKLAHQKYDALRMLDNTNYPMQGYAGYLMPIKAFALFSSKTWQDPPDVGDYFICPPGAITDTDQRTEEHKWTSLHNASDTFKNVKTGLTNMFEQCIDDAYHSG